jgi:hypothetical protein
MMRRNPVTKEKHIPDLRFRHTQEHFTIVPNAIIRNPQMSAVAMKILLIVMSNGEDWHSFKKVIGSMLVEGRDTQQKATQELENLGYLRRVYYYDPATKHLGGCAALWVTTDRPGEFDEQAIEKHLESHGLKQSTKPGTAKERKPGSPEPGLQEMGLQVPATRSQRIPIERIPKEIKKGILNTCADFLFLFPIAWQKDPEFVSAAEEFFHHRELQPKGFSPLAAKQAANKLKAVDMQAAIDALLMSVQKQWTGVFPTVAARFPAADTKKTKTPNCHKSPASILQDAFPNENSCQQFSKLCFKPALQSLASKDDTQASQLATNLVRLYQHIKDAQAKTCANDHRWSPIKIIQYYVDWISEQDWISSKGAYLFAPGATVFDRQFRAEMAELHTYWHDIITGLPTD